MQDFSWLRHLPCRATTKQAQRRQRLARRRTARAILLSRRNFGEHAYNTVSFSRAHVKLRENRETWWQGLAAIALASRVNARANAQTCALLRADAVAAILKVSGTVGNGPLGSGARELANGSRHRLMLPNRKLTHPARLGMAPSVTATRGGRGRRSSLGTA